MLPVLCQERTEGGEKGTSDGLTQPTVSAEIFSPAGDRVTPTPTPRSGLNNLKKYIKGIFTALFISDGSGVDV